MPRLYLLAVCLGSALDRDTNNFTLFNLVEQLQVPEVPLDLPLEVHTYFEFDDAERGQEFEVRLLMQKPDGEPRILTTPFPFTAGSPRERLRLRGLRVVEAGICFLTAQMRPRRRPEQPWQNFPASWPINVEHIPGDGAPPQAAIEPGR